MALDQEHRISQMEIELSALKEKVSFFNVIYGKFDVTLGKIQEMIENRRYENNEEIKDMYDRLAQSEKTILAEIKNVRDEMKSLHAEHNVRIDQIDKWRWLLVGGAAVAGWIAEKVFGLFSG